MLSSIKRFLERCNIAVAMFSGLIILFIGCILFIEVVMRYTGNPTRWIPEWSTYLFAWAMLCGAAYTLYKGKHVRVELFIMHLPRKARHVLDIITALAGAAFCVVICDQIIEHLADVMLTGETTATALRLPLIVKDSPMLLGFVLLVIQFLLIVADRIAGLLLLQRFNTLSTATSEAAGMAAAGNASGSAGLTSSGCGAADAMAPTAECDMPEHDAPVGSVNGKGGSHA